MSVRDPQSDLPRGLRGGSDVWDQPQASVILADDYFDAPPPSGGGPGPLTYADYLVNDPVGAGSTTFTGMGIGPAATDRWVIVALQVHNAAAASVSSVTIGGVSATLLYEAPTLVFAGTVWSFWKANVPTGTTANVAIATSAGIFYWASCATYYCAGEPTFHAGAFDNTYTGTTFSVTVDVPEGGAVIASVFNDGAGTLSSWVGVTADSTDDTRKDYYASEDQLVAETGRTVSFTTSAASSSSGFYGLGVLSIDVPELAGGGGGSTLKVWTGSAFGAKPAKAWTGSTWAEKPVKVWDGSTWV